MSPGDTSRTAVPRTRAFVGLGANEADPASRFAAALARLEEAGVRVAAVSRLVKGPYEGPSGPIDDAPPVWNAVAEVRATGSSDDLHRLLHDIERGEGRVRDGRLTRSLDLDLLAFGDEVRTEVDLTLPHAQVLTRAFVLGPWEEVAPFAVVPGTGRTVLEHAAALRAEHPERFDALAGEGLPTLPDLCAPMEVLRERRALKAWRDARSGTVGVVMTMGALHAGHAALVRRARAACDAVLATIFVNPLQFGPSEDLTRYPRTLEADLAVLRSAGAAAAYVPAPEDLYPPGFSTHVEPPAPSAGYEGAVRPGHFRGVTTVVLKLWQRTRPDFAFFGQKDAQQVAVLSRMAADLDLPGVLVACPTVRDGDGLALSSRNRYLSPLERSRALAIPRTLDTLALEVTRGGRREEILAAARSRMEAAGLVVDYLDLVDPERMVPKDPTSTSVGADPTLAVVAARAGATRLLDNRFVVVGGPPR